MNICFFLLDIHHLAGTERATISVVNELSKFHNVYIFTNVHRDAICCPLSANSVIVNIGVSTARQYVKLQRELIRNLSKYSIDVFVSVEVFSLLYTLPALLYLIKSKKSNLKIVTWEHFNFTVDLGLKFRRFARRLAARFADGIVVLTKRDVELWTLNLKIRSQISSIPNISPVIDDRSHLYASESTSMIAVGRLTYQKGFDRLLSIWKRVISRPASCSWKLNIVGSGEDEEMLKKQSRDLGIDSSVCFLGKTADVTSYYKNAAALLMTSRFEGLPMTLIEAQSFGLPIIAYDCLTGPAEVVDSGNGILVPDNDEDQFVDAVVRMQEDVSLRALYSKNARCSSQRYVAPHIGKLWSEFLGGL